MPEVTVRVPAKINLQLGVGPRRDDGFHDLATVFQAVSLYDDVVATPGSGISVRVEGEQAADVPTGADNLAARAAALLASIAGVDADVQLVLRKGIPVAGGMAGGSADAAATLVACDALWGTGVDRAEMLRLAARLGSDVPFSLVGGTAVGTGRGDQLTPALACGEFQWVLALADAGLSTPEVYAECDRLRDGRDVRPPTISGALMHALRAGDAEALGRALCNDLQDAACSLRPPLRQTIQVGLDYGALGGLVSGSGPTIAFLVRDAEAALDVAVSLSASGACRAVRRAHGPVPGARIIAGNGG